MNPSKKTAALLLCVFFVLSMLFSSALIIHEAGHDCAGEDCPICRAVAAAGSMLRFSGVLLAALTLLLGLADAGLIRRNARGLFAPSPRTPVQWKNRLNN